MAVEITIPRLGWSMEEGIFVKWLKADGDWVRAGEQLFLLESDKATQEIESIDDGLLQIGPDGPQPGDTVRVGQAIGHLLGKDEPALVKPQPAGGSSPAAGPAARRLARQMNVPLDGLTGSADGGRITSEDVHAEADRRRAAAGDRQQISARNQTFEQQIQDTLARSSKGTATTPRARRAARELGIDLSSLTGSGRGGRIRERDVRQAAPGRSRGVASGEAAPPSVPAADRAVSIRRTIARRMVASHQSTAPVTLTTKVDATNLINLRNQFKSAAAGERDVIPSITDVVIKLLAGALEKHPQLNARWEEDRIVELAEINVGIAVDTDAGLLVPVVHDVPRLGLRAIAARAVELIARARAGTCSVSELQGGTITVTNLGVYGIDAFTPIINPPETAILGLGAIRREPAFDEQDRVVPRETMTLSLTFDHRVVDGAPAARFLEALCRAIENPVAWLVG
jgi:pyruvate dehydrogenase E2 component (dihydrolipoamide acetyltransferase)